MHDILALPLSLREIKRGGGVGKEGEFGHVESEMPVRHSSGDSSLICV